MSELAIKNDRWVIGATVYFARVAYGYVEYDKSVIKRVTPCGFWYMRASDPTETWATFGTHKVSLTKEEALRNAIVRRHLHIEFAKKRLAKAEDGLKILLDGEEAPLLRIFSLG